jgi:voltage-gated potassium channel
MINIILRNLKLFRAKISRTQIGYIITLYVIVNAIGMLGIYLFEYGINEAYQNVWDMFWFMVVTSTTVGYGDKFPITLGGQIVTIFIMIFGIGLLGMMLAEFSSQLVERRLKKKMGQLSSPHKEHILILGWNHKGQTIVKEILSDGSNTRITILALLNENPIQKDEVFFVKGNPSLPSDLAKAGLDRAKSAILLADQSSDDDSWHDAKTVLVALAVHKYNPQLRMSAEVVDIENVPHLKNAGVTDCIVTNEISSHMLVRSAFYASANEVVSELLTNQGNEIITVPLAADWFERSFKQAVDHFITEWQSIPIGIVRGDSKHINPPSSFSLDKGDQLILITSQEHKIRKHIESYTS